MKRKVMALLLALIILLPLTACSKQSAQDELLKAMAQEAEKMANFFSQELNMYNNSVASADFTGMPESFDLRALGYVPQIKEQGSWGTCWAFSIIGASEISILSEMGLTTEEYASLTGHPMDLSEKHLTWFANGSLPALKDYPQGEYIYPGYESQAGEGIFHLNKETVGPNALYSNGGWVAYGSTMFSSGIGPVWERDYPYVSSNGILEFSGDWSLPEQSRFTQNAQLENSVFLPTPAMRDDQGRYVYNEAGTHAIKSELLEGRAVAITYHSDQSMDPDASIKDLNDLIKSLGLDITMEDTRFYVQYIKGSLVVDELTLEQARILFLTTRVLEGLTEEEANAEAEETSHSEILKILKDSLEKLPGHQEGNKGQNGSGSVDPEKQEKMAREIAESIGIDYDKLKEHLLQVNQADSVNYMSTKNWAQYVNNEYATPDHGVVIVGWDDNYPAENFLEGKQPPANGAWIVRNTWGESYGNDGYFYLSYYDKTISAPQTFDFATKPNPELPEKLVSTGWDFMPSSRYSTVHMDKMVQQANIFSFDTKDSVLEFVSVFTADLNTKVKVDVYLLNEGTQKPDDGVLLDSVTKEFAYGGYHRIELSGDFLLPLGSRVGVVVTQSINGANGTVYSLPYSMGRNEKFSNAMTTFAPESMNYDSSVGRIGKGESFVKVGEQWMDWSDILQAHRKDCRSSEFLSYDNFGIKVHTYLLEDIQDMHEFGNGVDSNGVTEHRCNDCGYCFFEKK